MSNYTIYTRDVDGSDKRNYKTLDKALARFAEMVGFTLEAAIADLYYDCTPVPTIRAVKSVRAVSNFGCVVEFQRNCEPEAEPVAPAPVLSDDYDVLAARHEEIGEHINDIEEGEAEAMTQYRSECALFGDAGPGQHPSCWQPASAAAKAALLAEAKAIGEKMEALRPTPPLTDAEREDMRLAGIAAANDPGMFDIPF